MRTIYGEDNFPYKVIWAVKPYGVVVPWVKRLVRWAKTKFGVPVELVEGSFTPFSKYPGWWKRIAEEAWGKIFGWDDAFFTSRSGMFGMTDAAMNAVVIAQDTADAIPITGPPNEDRVLMTKLGENEVADDLGNKAILHQLHF